MTGTSSGCSMALVSGFSSLHEHEGGEEFIGWGLLFLNRGGGGRGRGGDQGKEEAKQGFVQSWDPPSSESPPPGTPELSQNLVLKVLLI